MSNETVLRCPVCDSEYLHAEQTDVYERNEDSNVGCHTTVAFHHTTVDLNMKNNPSSRRDGLTITFSCEQCVQPFIRHTLAIYQHKGMTIQEWINVLDTSVK